MATEKETQQAYDEFRLRHRDLELEDGTRAVMGPVRNALSDEQMKRIRHISLAVGEVYPITLEQWADGFSRDMHPDRNIDQWEHLAGAFEDFCSSRGRSVAEKHEVFVLLLNRQRKAENKALGSHVFEHLDRDDAVRALSQYVTRDPDRHKNYFLVGCGQFLKVYKPTRW